MPSPVLLQYARTAMALSLGARFGRHDFLTASGSGSRGVACQTPGARLAPHAAIEFGPPQIDSDPHFRGHFDCEAKAIAALNQPPAADSRLRAAGAAPTVCSRSRVRHPATLMPPRG